MTDAVADRMSSPVSALVSARDLSVTLAGRSVLAGVDLDLHAGQIVVLIGPNGGGKTTLLRALLGQVPATGNINWLGRPLARWSRRDLARTVAYLPQAPTFESDDRVIDVLRLGRLPHGGWLGLDSAGDDAIVNDVAADLALTELLARPVDTLSGGQRQRVFLGRALVQRPKAILLDEPATYLDLRHQVELYTLLGRLARDRPIAILMASHDVNLSLLHADEAMIMKDGRVLASGDIETVMTEERLSEAFDVSIRRVRDGGRSLFVV